MKTTLIMLFVMVCLMGTIAEAKYIKHTKFTRTEIENKLLAGDKNFPYNDFSDNYLRLDFSNANLTHCGFGAVRIDKSTKFAGATLTGANFIGATFLGVNFSNAKMSGANFLNAKVHGANWQGADLTKAKIYEAWFNGKTEYYKNRVDTYMPTNLAGVNFTDADCRNTRFNGTNCTGANFTGADLTNAHFDKANLTGAIVDLGTTKGINFADWKKRGAIIQGL